MKNRTQYGFTLIELMITIGIIGILSAIAYPAYTAHIEKTRRVSAQSCLTELAQAMQRNYSVCLRYDKTGAGCATDTSLPVVTCTTQLAGFYDFDLSSTIDQNNFSVEAAPVNTTSCGTLTLDQDGEKSASGTGTSCWPS